MDTIKKENLVTFFKENDVSERNQEIVIEYLNSLERIGRKNATISNYTYFLRFLVKTVRTDIDKFTIKDVNEIQDAINNLKKENGKSVSDTTKMSYKLMLQHFLKQYGKSSRNGALIKLSKFDIVKAKGKKLEPEDLLTEEEVDRIISCSTGIRDKALISFIYELGARIGEVQNCKMKDVKEHPYGFHITLDGKTGPRQVILHKNQAWLKKWLENHPNPDDPEAPLFTTTREYTETSYRKNRKKHTKEDPKAHTPLKAISMSHLLKKAARKAGIKKRVYCHLLRHSQATRLASYMTEQQLKMQFGWVGSSSMVQTYVHLNNTEVDKAVLTSYGIRVVEDKKENKISRCARCNTPIAAGSKWCDCGMPITIEAKEAKDSTELFVNNIILKHPELQKIFFEELVKLSN